MEFCKRQGLDHSKFKNWLHRLKADEMPTQEDFIPVRVNGGAPSDLADNKDNALNQVCHDSPIPELKLCLPNDLILMIPQGFDISMLRQAVKVLMS
jgi:hypothetical protein